jgi:hypothetical protein
LTTALAAFQEHIPTIAKGKTATVPTKNGGQYRYDYADLADITPQVLPLLAAEGLAWTAITDITDAGNLILRYQLRHESGEEITGAYPLGPASLPPQQIGSALTYARRYALCAVTGLAPGGDDDDARGYYQQPQPQAAPAQHRPAAPAPRPLTRQQADDIQRYGAALELDADTLQKTAAYATGGACQRLQDLTEETAGQVLSYLASRWQEREAAQPQPTLDGGEEA